MDWVGMYCYYSIVLITCLKEIQLYNTFLPLVKSLTYMTTSTRKFSKVSKKEEKHNTDLLSAGHSVGSHIRMDNKLQM